MNIRASVALTEIRFELFSLKADGIEASFVSTIIMWVVA